MTLHAHLRTLRESAGLTCPQVAESLGVSRTIVYQWEKPYGRPEAGNLRRLLTLYRASDADELAAWRLLGDASAPPERDPAAEASA